MMRLRSRHVRWISLVALAVLLFCLLRAFIFEAPELQPPRPWSRAANDGVLDELLDEAFTRPADRSALPSFVIDAGHLPAGVLRFGIVEKRASPLCPEGSLEAPISARVRAFQPLVDTGDLPAPVFLYSAFLETELDASSSSSSSLLNVRLLGLMERGFRASLFCQLWFRQGPRPLSLLPVRHLALTEPPADPKVAPSLFEAVELHCTETEVQLSDPTPYAVSVVPAAHLCDSPVNVLPVLLTAAAPAAPPLPPPSAVPSAGLAVCCATPLHEAVDPAWLIEWLEAQRLFGASRVFLYLLKDRLHAPTPALYRVLRAFTQHKGLVTALDWPLPPRDVFANVWPDGGAHSSIFLRWGRILAANDCLRRLSTAAGQLFRYAVIADLNEVLVPGQRFNDWAGLFLRAPSVGPAAFTLRAARVQPATAEEREALGGAGLNLTVRQRTARVSRPGADANLVLDPARVSSFSADGSVRLREPQQHEAPVPLHEDEALVFTYDDEGARLSEADLVLDERLAQFSYRLANAVLLTKEALRRT